MIEDGIDPESRMLLLRFACAVAWTDFELHPRERAAIVNLVERLGLTGSERLQVEGWLSCPPDPDDVDPQLVPPSLRELFLLECEAIVRADGVVRPEEADTMSLLRQILGVEAERS